MSTLLKLYPRKLTIDEFVGCSPVLKDKNRSYGVYPIQIARLEDWQKDGGRVLFEALYGLTRLGFIQDFSPSLWQDTMNHLENGEHLYLVCDGSIVAYAVFDFWTKDRFSILYLSGIMVNPDHQGKSISSSLLDIVMEDFKPQLLAARTQNPVMYESIKRSCIQIFPNADYLPPVDIVEVGKFIAEDKLNMSAYDPETMLGVATYGTCLYGKEPVSKSHVIEKWFKNAVNLQRGDAMIIVGVR